LRGKLFVKIAITFLAFGKAFELSNRLFHLRKIPLLAAKQKETKVAKFLSERAGASFSLLSSVNLAALMAFDLRSAGAKTAKPAVTFG